MLSVAMKSFRLRQALLVSAAAIALLGPASRPTAAGSPPPVLVTVTKCNSTANVETCLSVTGSGDYVQSAVSQATVYVESTIDIELVAPSVDRHSGWMSAAAGGSRLGPDWCHDGVLPSGSTITAITRRQSPDGKGFSDVVSAPVNLPI